MLYSKDGSYPSNLPNRIRLSSGLTRTDSSTFTEDEIADAGYIVVEDPPIPAYPNKVEWTGTAWIERSPNQVEIDEQWKQIREQRNKLLSQTDIEILKCYETSTPVPSYIVTYRQELRDLPQVQQDPFNIVWPVLAIPEESTV